MIQDMAMNNVRTACALALLISFIFAPTVPAAGQASSNPAVGDAAHHPWASFNPGSWVKIRSSTTETASKKETNIVETKITLLEKTADKVVLENEMTMMGQTTKTTFDLPLKGYSDAVPEGMTVLKTGSETITIAGKSVTCETMEASMNAGGTKILFKNWTSRQVPGSLVKSVTPSNGSQGTAEVVDFKTY
jgi:hypothetical protein